MLSFDAVATVAETLCRLQCFSAKDIIQISPVLILPVPILERQQKYSTRLARFDALSAVYLVLWALYRLIEGSKCRVRVKLHAWYPPVRRVWTFGSIAVVRSRSRWVST